MNIQKIREHKVSSILQFAIPGAIGMLLSTVVTITDGYFTGNYVGSEGLAAINLGLPLLYFYLAVGLMIGVGGSVIAGISLGEQNYHKAKNVFNQSVVLTFGASVLISIIAGLFFNQIILLLGISGITKTLFVQYYRIFLFYYPFMVLSTCSGMFLRAEGKPQVYMIIGIFTVLLNGLLDFVFCRFTQLGIQGISYASFITCGISVALYCIYFVAVSEVFRLGKFRWQRETVRSLFLNGSSEFIGEMASCISMYCYNYVCMKYAGYNGVTAFTVLGYAVFVFSMILIGFGEGMCPLVSFCFGAGEVKLCRQLRKITLGIVTAIGFVFVIVLLNGAKTYAEFFVKNEAVIYMVVRGFKFFAPVFLITGVNVICSMYFTSIIKAKESALISFLRGILLLLISIFLFSRLWGLDGIWLTSPVTEGLTCIVTMILIWKEEYGKLNS